jgi:hypothetical protein
VEVWHRRQFGLSVREPFGAPPWHLGQWRLRQEYHPHIHCVVPAAAPRSTARIRAMPKHRRPPAETEIQEYFRVSPPLVHPMVLTLERASTSS